MIESFQFTPAGERDFKNLSRQLQDRIAEKIRLYISSHNPLHFAKPLINLPPATHRFRVGKYRVCFYIKDYLIVIDGIDTREDAYRKR